MRGRLRNWIADADTRHSVTSFELPDAIPALTYQDGRLLDLYSSLVGELFDQLRAETVSDERDWPTLGNAFSLVGSQMEGRTQADAFFYSAAAYYLGGMSASAYLTMRQTNPSYWDLDSFRACYDLLARPAQTRSDRMTAVLAALAQGDLDQISAAQAAADRDAGEALRAGPDEWVSTRVLVALLDRFQRSNIRAVLPDGGAARWTPLITSLLERRPAMWDFFPSQIDAIEAGLLGTEATFSMQMPTGAGKTALTETLIYDHLVNRPHDLAILLVPFRSLARELRNSMGRRLTQMGFATRTVYGGTVPRPEETQHLDEVKVIIATPESMVGLLGTIPELSDRISLLVCDEGHLLDSAGRGVGLELLLTRFLARTGATPRKVFVSAVVPNIEEINSWLGGTSQTVVRSDFRPAGAEYSVLRSTGGTGRQLRLGLELRPQTGTNLPTHTIPDFLSARDFTYFNELTRRNRTYTYDSVKTQAVAAARKALPLGTVAVFTRPKRGPQGVIALAQELAEQLAVPLNLPRPTDFVTGPDRLADIAAYLTVEYGPAWVGTTALAAGAVVHHGDIPQETREALEEILVAGNVRLVLCTSTLAEGVNLPIRTLVVYTTQIQTPDGTAVPMLAREVRNLVGRAGRAGSATKGLVICANPNQWNVMSRIADGAPGEPVQGALLGNLNQLVQALMTNNRALSNTVLEAAPMMFPVVDGIDATLIELLRDDLGDDEFRRIAATFAASTYAWRQMNQNSRTVLENVFTLRADRLTELRNRRRASWAAGTGVRPRLLDSIADSLVPGFARWQTVEDPADIELLDALLTWARRQPDFANALREAYPAREINPIDRLPVPADLLEQLRQWLSGNTFAEMSASLNRDVDQLLRIHAGALSYAFATLVEQAVVVLQQIFTSPNTDTGADAGVEDRAEAGLAPVVSMLPDYVRYGVSTLAACNLMADGVRYRRAANLLGQDSAMTDPANLLLTSRDVARTLLERDPDRWRTQLGSFVYERTADDLGITDTRDDR